MHSRPRKDDVPWQQRRALTQERNHLLYTEDHVPGPTILDNVTIQLCRDLQFLRIRNDVRCSDARAKRRPAVKALAQTPLPAAALHLPFAVGDVVADSIAEDVVQGFSHGDIECFAADDYDKLAFVVEAGSLEGWRVDRYRIERAG